MKIHSDIITRDDIATAATYAAAAGHGRVYADEITERGSRSKARAFEVKLIGDGTHSRKRNAANTGYAATFESWGYFFASLYNVDPNMTCLPYSSADDFHTKTRNEYHAPARHL